MANSWVRGRTGCLWSLKVGSSCFCWITWQFRSSHYDFAFIWYWWHDCSFIYLPNVVHSTSRHRCLLHELSGNNSKDLGLSSVFNVTKNNDAWLYYMSITSLTITTCLVQFIFVSLSVLKKLFIFIYFNDIFSLLKSRDFSFSHVKILLHYLLFFISI